MNVKNLAAALTVSIISVLSSVPAGAQGASEGIGVHGHWSIKVRNPDGTLVKTREFENALESPGKQELVNVLTGASSIAGWAIKLETQASITASPFYAGQTQDYVGLIMPTEQSISNLGYGSLIFTGLTYEGFETRDDVTGTVDVGVILHGVARARKAGDITQVGTYTYNCPISVVGPCPPINYAQRDLHRFSGKVISPITLEPDQLVDVKVRLTFR